MKVSIDRARGAPPRFPARVLPLLFAALAAASCASVRERAGWLLPGLAGRLAGDAVIVRDSSGVPHIYAESDAAAAFALGYAQAEDDFYRIETTYIHALGRSANLWGSAWLGPDLVRATFDIVALARAEYEREPRERKRIWDAFAMGVNQYLELHPEVRPRLLHRIEPWYAFAVPHSRLLDRPVAGLWLGVPLDPARDTTLAPEWLPVAEPAVRAAGASGLGIGWAVAPSRTADGRTYAVLEIAGTLDDRDRPYEAHVESEAGWRVAGAWLFGTAAPLAGHDGSRAWSRSIEPGHAEAGEALDLVPLRAAAGDSTHALDGRPVLIESRQFELPVNSPAGVVTRAVVVRTTDAGPVVAARGDTLVALRVRGFEQGGLLPQLLDFSLAAGFDEFASVAARPVAPAGIVLYADTAGMLARGTVGPTRALSGAFAPADADWVTGVPFDDRPTESAVLARLGRPDARLAAIAARVNAIDAWSFDEWAALAMDARYTGFPAEVARLVDVWERIGAFDPDRARPADHAIDMLRAFDGAVDTLSPGATVYAVYALALGGDTARLDALGRAADALRHAHGTLDVPPAAVWRLALPADTSAADRPPGHAVRAGPPSAGTISAVRFDLDPDSAALARVTHARTWVMAVALGATAEARSVVPFAQAHTARDASGAAVAAYMAGRLEPMPFDSADVAAAAVRRYSPGG